MNKSVGIIHFSGSFSAAADIDTLKQRNISYIITLDICPLPVHITELPFLTTKYIHGTFDSPHLHTFIQLYN